MKKIMIYTKHSGKYAGINAQMKANASIIMFFSIYICGMLLGCSLYLSASGNSIVRYAANMLFQSDLRHIVYYLTFTATAFTVLSAAGALACTGIPLLFANVLFNGAVYGMAACRLFSEETEYFFVKPIILLPGAALWNTIILLMSALSTNCSAAVARNIFFNQKVSIPIKPYSKYMLFLFALLLLSAGIQIVSIRSYLMTCQQ